MSLAILTQSRKLRMHIDEFCDGGGGACWAELGVDTADHAHYGKDARSQMKLPSEHRFPGHHTHWGQIGQPPII